MARIIIHKPFHVFENEVISAMTISLWNLQLQLFELSEEDMVMYFNCIYISSLYEENEFTNKMLRLCAQLWPMSEQDRLCLATHISLQLLGLGDL